MSLNNNDSKRIFEFYNTLYQTHWPNNHASLSWNSPLSEKIRYEVLLQSYNFTDQSILDVWCWFWWFYTFLKEKWILCTYTGVDIMDSFYQQAKKNHPESTFFCDDFSKEKDFGCYDIVIASWVLSFKVENYKQVYFAMIEKMFQSSKKVTAFNLLNEKFHPNDDTFASYSIGEVYEFCTTLTNRLILRQDYLPHDITFYLYHE